MKERQRELLLKLRSVLVGEMHVQPYIIYPDETIDLLLEAQPKTLDDLSKVKGFPETGKRFKGFGEQVIAIFNDANAIDEFEIKNGAVTSMPKKMVF